MISLLRRPFVSAEPAKAATEGKYFPEEKGALFTLALFGAKVKATAARAITTDGFIETEFFSEGFASQSYFCLGKSNQNRFQLLLIYNYSDDNFVFFGARFDK